jgi:hypothetical protein
VHEPEIARLTALMRSWQQEVGDRLSHSVKAPRPKAVRFDNLDHKPDEWQPRWIVAKSFRGR